MNRELLTASPGINVYKDGRGNLLVVADSGIYTSRHLFDQAVGKALGRYVDEEGSKHITTNQNGLVYEFTVPLRHTSLSIEKKQSFSRAKLYRARGLKVHRAVRT